MNLSKDSFYSWHLTLRADRPVEGCSTRPHAYLHGKKLDERDMDKHLPPHTKKCRDPPPAYEFSFRWFRGPPVVPCAYAECPRRTSFSPLDWSQHALGGSGCSLQCISTQSSLYKCIFCNAKCFVQAWKTQYTIPKGRVSGGSSSTGGGSGSRAATPVGHRRSGSFGSCPDDDIRSIDSGDSYGGGSAVLNGRRFRNQYSDDGSAYSNPGTPKAYSAGYSSGGGGVAPEYGSGNEESQEWLEISRDQVYVPTFEDVGRKLKVEASAYSVETGELLMSRVVKTELVLSRPPDPPKRNLVTTKTGGASGGARFRIATYNVLAEIYATQHQYPYCDFWALSWDYRFQNIFREIVDASPDAICLQEVQADHYENQIYAAMSDAGYEGVYKQKTRQSMGLAGKVDGCALFWRRSKFVLIESYSIEFNELAQRQATQLFLNPRSEEGAAFINRLSKDNVAQLVVLELAQPSLSRTRSDQSNQVCIANTHLYSNKDFPDIKLWQSLKLLQELETFVLSRGTQLPLMICGDFNSTPDTAVYDLLSRQAVHPNHPDINVNSDDAIPNILPDPMNIKHSFQLGSAYQTVMGEEPPNTNFTTNFKGVLDYMWYSAHNLRPLSTAPIPDEAALTRHGEALPSTQYSSDHIMLISDMQIMSSARPP